MLLLFDIDGTLVSTGGAGQRAMSRAFADVFGAENAFAQVELAGRTDASIVADVLAAHTIPHDERLVIAFRTRYVACLREEIRRRSAEEAVLPGVVELLRALESQPCAFLGLLTGNYADAAEIKLARFDLWRYFRCGAFGEDHHDRNHLVPVALRRARACGLGLHVDASRVIVLGDTPRDVECARAHGARCVAVATGSSDRGVLLRAGADVVFDDFSDTVRVLDALRHLVPGGITA